MSRPCVARSTRVDPKGRKTALHPGAGANSAIFSDDFSHYISIFSNSTTPTTTAVYATGSLRPLRVLKDNKEITERLKDYRLRREEFIKIPNGRGQELNAWILKPYDFDPNKKYPVLMTQYQRPRLTAGTRCLRSRLGSRYSPVRATSSSASTHAVRALAVRSGVSAPTSTSA